MNIGAEIPFRRSRLGRPGGLARTGSLVFDRGRQEKLSEAADTGEQVRPAKDKGTRKPRRH